jgi:hypothetical protein
VFGYVRCVVWEYFVCVHPHHIIMVIGLCPLCDVNILVVVYTCMM